MRLRLVRNMCVWNLQRLRMGRRFDKALLIGNGISESRERAIVAVSKIAMLQNFEPVCAGDDVLVPEI